MNESCSGLYYIIYLIFGECINTFIQALSLILGYISILCWINVQFPQIYENYLNKSVESLSARFLTLWALGDVSNLIGSILTHQLPFQIFLATYFVLIDFILIFQFYYYSPSILENEVQPLINKTPKIRKRSLISILLFFLISLIFIQPSFIHELVGRNGFKYVAGFKYFFNIKKIGQFISWFCTILYIISRMPQIYKNFKRKSTDGLSVYMFMFAFIGNLCYSASILSSQLSDEQFYSALPFILGSAGTMWLDLILFVQFHIYKKILDINTSSLEAITVFY